MPTPPDLDDATKENTLESALSLSVIYQRSSIFVAPSSRRYRFPRKFQNIKNFRHLSEDKHSESTGLNNPVSSCSISQSYCSKRDLEMEFVV